MNQTESSFLQNVVLAAQQSQREFGIPASVTIAQAILESAWGQSGLAKQANNFFGIKATAKADASQYIEMPTDEFVDGRKVEELAKFARYASPIDSFHAHGYLLSMELRYKPAMAVVANPAEFAQALQDCGYSTSPTYAAGLMDLVAEYDLTQYDVPAGSATSPAAGSATSPATGSETSAAVATPAAVAAQAAMSAHGPVVVTLHAPAGVAATSAVAAAIQTASVKTRPKVVSAAGPSRAQVLAEAEKLIATRAAAQAAAKATPATPAKGK